MPYERKGKCVYKQPSDKKVGCSDSVAKAKKYIKALYASEVNESIPNVMTPEEHNLAVQKYMKTFIEDKDTWIEKYGLKKANFVMYKTAVKKAKEEFEKEKAQLNEAMDRNELLDKIKPLIQQIYSDQMRADMVAVEFDELVKFPELKRIIIDLLSTEFDNFLASIDWVAPKPTTFRINLKNDQEFYLTYTNRSWIAKIEGKKYYLLNLPEEQKATEAIARILSYGSKEAPTDEFGDTGGAGGGEEFGGEMGGAGETAEPETGEETGGEETEA